MFEAGVLYGPGSLLSSAACCTGGQRLHLNGKVSTAWQVSEVFVRGEKEFSLLKIYVLQKITAPADCCSYWKHMVAVGRNIKCYSVVPVEKMQGLQMISNRPEISEWFMIQQYTVLVQSVCFFCALLRIPAKLHVFKNWLWAVLYCHQTVAPRNIMYASRHSQWPS